MNSIESHAHRILNTGTPINIVKFPVWIIIRRNRRLSDFIYIKCQWIHRCRLWFLLTVNCFANFWYRLFTDSSRELNVVNQIEKLTFAEPRAKKKNDCFI